MKFKDENGQEWEFLKDGESLPLSIFNGDGEYMVVRKAPKAEPMPELLTWDRICGMDPESGCFTAVVSQVGSFYTSLVDVFDGGRSELRSWDFVEKIHRNGKLIWERK